MGKLYVEDERERHIVDLCETMNQIHARCICTPCFVKNDNKIPP
jgi:hypothetical protein